MIRAFWVGLAALFRLGRGRPVAIALLLGLASGNLLTQSFFVPLATPFESARQWLFDRYQRWQPRAPQSHPATIIAIDEASLRQLGQWPWPRDRIAALLHAIATHQPAAIGLDIYFPEADRTSPPRIAAQLPANQSTLAIALSRLPDHDTLLADALRATPSVLGAAGFDFQALTTQAGLRTTPLVVQGADPLRHVRRYPWVLASLPALQSAASGQALLSVDSGAGGDGVVRRLPLVAAVNDQLVPALALEMLRVATGSALSVSSDPGGIRQIGVADLLVPTQAGGDIWLHFAPLAAGLPRYLSAADVLAGHVDHEQLEGKLVMIGLTGLGFTDQRITPLGEQVPGIEIQAQLAEAIFDGRLLLRPSWLPGMETLLVVLIGGLLIWRVPHFGALPSGAPPPPPRRSLWITALVIVALFAGGMLLFSRSGLLFDAASISLMLAALMASLVRSVFLEISRRGALLAAERQRLREAAAQAAGELSAAGRIQLGALPRAAPLLRGETRFTLAPLLEPAQDIGGDLYDFFMIDARHLGFVIGDVSGKGLPASLFMAVTKTLVRTLAKHVRAGPDVVAALTNTELAEANPEALFVTALIGVLDVDSGALTLVNAGHDAPWLLHRDGGLTRLDSPPDAGGPPLCMLDDFPYGAQQARLAPGDTLVMATDGITEAMNAGGDLYGYARLEAALQAGYADTIEDLIRRIRADVARHVREAEPSDDMTLLVIRWKP